MVIDERARHVLYERLDEVLGQEEAATLMSHLPPVGWADVATRRDVDSATVQVRSEMAEQRAELRAEMAGLRAEIKHDLAVLTRTLMISMITSVLAAAGLAFSAARLM